MVTLQSEIAAKISNTLKVSQFSQLFSLSVYWNETNQHRHRHRHRHHHHHHHHHHHRKITTERLTVSPGVVIVSSVEPWANDIHLALASDQDRSSAGLDVLLTQ